MARVGAGNYVHDQLDGGVTGALYPDQGSAYSRWYNNALDWAACPED